MNNLKIVGRSFFKKGRSNIIKIISLGTGLAVALVLLSKISFDNNFDNFYPDSDRIYLIHSNIQSLDKEVKKFNTVSGAISVGAREEVPEIETSTRFTNLSSNNTIFTTIDKKRYEATFILADSCLFDILSRPIIAGNVKEVLSRPMYVMVAEKVANKIGGDVIGQQIQLEDYPGRILTIGGIFKDIPQNSIFDYDIVVSISSIGNFMWDGSMNWVGNDRYTALVKLREGANPDDLSQPMRRMQEKYQDIDKIEREAGIDLTYTFSSLEKEYSESPAIKRMSLILTIIAITLLFTSIFNYLLIVLTNLMNRSKEIGVYKCYGASEKNIASLIFIETGLHLSASLLLAGILIISFKSPIEDILGSALSDLISIRSIILILIVCIIVFLIAAIIPTYILSRIPVESAFRNPTTIRKGWKQIFLSIQFVSSIFLFTLLLIVGKQYNTMINDDTGYTYENLIYAETYGSDFEKRDIAIEKIKQLPEVEMVSCMTSLPFQFASGNNVSIPNDPREIINIADLYFVDKNYFSLMNIPIEEGTSFNDENISGDIVVSKKFVELMKVNAGWTGSIIGKNVDITEHGLCKIVGVYPDIRIGSITQQDTRASVIFYADPEKENIRKNYMTIVGIKLREINPDNIQKLNEIFKSAIPEKETRLIPYDNEMIKLYSGEKRFRDAILVGGVVTILITLIGLIGYLNNEITRRTTEIAIRRINGAALFDILKLFFKNILKVALPAAILGSIAAYFVAEKWMEDFSEKAELSPLLFLSCAIGAVLMIEIIVTVVCTKITNKNPVDSLKSE